MYLVWDGSEDINFILVTEVTHAGIIYIAVSILTCGAGAVIFNLIALVEGIIYLTKSDEEFYQMYQIETKEWF